MELYEIPPSGNCHKVRMMLSFLQLPYVSVTIDPANLEQRSEYFLKMNPFGQVPVLKDGEQVIWDSQAILVYLARRYGDFKWLPLDHGPMSRVMEWLSVSANEISRSLAPIRAHYKFGRAVFMEDAQQVAANLLGILERHLESNEWLAADHITIADVAVYPYVALAPEAKIDLTPAICAWISRIQALPGYVGMPHMWQGES